MKNSDLGQGWFASANDDGSFTLRNCDKGQRIDLSADNAALFARLWDEHTNREILMARMVNYSTDEDGGHYWSTRSGRRYGPFQDRQAARENAIFHLGA